LLGLAAGADSALAATSTTFTKLDVPGAQSTEVHGVIRVGPLLHDVQAVGIFQDSAGTHGFLWSGGSFTTLNAPGASSTWAMGINRSGQIVGQFAGSDGVLHGFLLASGTYTTLTCPLSVGVGPSVLAPNAINDAGTIVGDEGPAGFTFVSKRCVFPLRQNGQNALFMNGINNNTVAAATIVDARNATHGETLSPLAPNENATQIDFPGAVATLATGINDSGQIAGSYQPAKIALSPIHGYTSSGGTFATLDFPGAFRTEPFAIDNPFVPSASYDVAGFYSEQVGPHHGFIATLTPQALRLP
jgi:uncharacterized membrane protein